MRMRPKSAIIYLILPLLILTVTGAVAAVAPTRLQPLAAVLAVILFLLFGGAQFVVLVCPKCGASAIRTPSGGFTPLVGARCRYCHNDY